MSIIFNKKHFLIISIFFLLTSISFGQNGPGGVGNSSGTNGQPQNVLWLDADSLSYADGADLSSWTDLSGNGNNLSQSNSSYTPIFKNDASNINGHPRAVFSKSNNRIVLNPFDDMPSSGITTFFVYKTSGSSDALLSYATGSGTASNEFLLFNNNNLTTYFLSSNKASGVSLNSGNWQIMEHQWKSSNGDLKIYNDGDQKYSTVFQSGHSIASGGSLSIGGEQDAIDGGYDASQAFSGEIAEIIMYNSSLNSAQRLIIENYLSQKYNIAFSTASNDKYTGNDAAYVYNIAGIGKEADGAQTESSSAGFYVYERNSTLSNGEYIMFANNNAPNSSSTIVTDATVTTCGAQAAWNRNWYIKKTASDGIDAKFVFDFKEALSDGQYPDNVSNYVLLFRNGTTGNYSKVTVAGQGILDADQVYFDIDNANLQDGYYTIGTDDETASPIEGKTGKTWYALASGDWDNWEYWTLDPSGSLPNNPKHETPGNSDKVVIQTGKTITLSSNNKTVSQITVDGILDLGNSSGHNFTIIKGNGRIKLKSDNFPAGDATDFVSKGQGQGTVVWQGSSYSLSSAHTFYNMEVELDNPSDVLTLLSDYTINGHLYINKGIFQINNNSATTDLNLTVKGNLNIESEGQIATGSANARHQLNLYSDFTNNGTAKFTNRSSADYNNEASDGIVDVNFLSDNSNQTILCNGITNFYRIKIDKGNDDTYILDIKATSPSYFNLFGYAHQSHASTAQLTTNANALALIKGTVRINSNVSIPALNNTGNYNISEAAKLWINGGTVKKNAGTAIVPYGVIQISSGLLEAKVNSGITLRNNGLIKISGGTINTNQIRTSVLGAGNVGGYVQSGGTVNIINASNSYNSYYHFSLTYPGNVFNMSGGTLHIYDANDDDQNSGGIFIASDPTNVNVTGGTVIAEISSAVADTFKITSKAPFWNLILRNTNDATSIFKLDAGTNINGSSSADLAAQNLIVYNNLTIEKNCFLDHNGKDITIGGNFSIAANSQKHGNNYGLLYDTLRPNTLTFNGSGSDTLYIGHNKDDSYELFVWNLTINKKTGSQIVLKGDPNKDPTQTTVSPEWHNRLLEILGTINVKNGTLNQGHQSIRLYADVYVSSTGVLGIYKPGITPLTAYIMLKDDSTSTDLHTEKGAQLGNFKLNPGNNYVVGIFSDVHIKRIGYWSGSLNMRTYNLKVDYLNDESTLTNFPTGSGSSKKMIFSDANASDGGLSIMITGNGTYGFPLGTKADASTRYTWADVTISNFADTGYITIRPVDDTLRTTNLSGGEILSYYWRVGYSDFSTLPTVKYQFKYRSHDVGNENKFYPGKVLDEEPFTRSYEQKANIDKSNNIITFDDTGGTSGNTGNGFTLEKANYTAGATNRFTGTVAVFKSVATYQNWNTNTTWDQNKVPTAGSIVIIENKDRVWGNNIPNTPAEVRFVFDYGSNPNPSSEDVPRLQFNTSGTFNIGIVSGPGMISFNMSKNPTVVADFGDFANDSDAYFMYYGANATLNNIPSHIPNLMVESKNFIIDQKININRNLIIQGDANLTPYQDITIGKDLKLGAWNGGSLIFHDNSSKPATTVTVDGNIDFTELIAGNYNDRNILVADPGTTLNLEHKLIVKGDIIQGSKDNFDFNLFNAADRPRVILELQGKTNNSYYRTSNSVPNLYRIVMNKGTSQTDTFSFNNNFILNGQTSGVGVSKAIELQNGTLVLNDTSISVNLTTGDDNFKIPASSCLELKRGKAYANGNSGIILDGKLLIDGGSLDMTGGDNFIQYSASGNATIDISSGTLKVGSQIRRGTASTEGILTYKQTGGTVEIGTDAAGENKRGIFEILNAGSSFSLTGGTFSLVNDYRTNPTTQSFYFDPETSNMNSNATINFGDTNTVAGKGNFTIYANKNLMNLTLNNVSSKPVKLTMQTVPLTLDGTLTIQNGTELDANGLDLNIYGDFSNTGTFTANKNTTYFKNSSDQLISGNTRFYNLTNENSANLNLATSASEIKIDNILTLKAGTTLNDNKNNIYVYGDIENNGTHIYGGSGDGISLVGTSEQTMTGDGHYGKLTINNAAGISVPVGNTITIDNELKMANGIFNISGNLLVLEKNCQIIEANPFGTNNMIQTNISFTDNGVKKYFPSGAYNFTYPIGSGGKYTPIIVNITQNSNETYLIAKSSNERHPSIQEDSESPDPEIVDSLNVLQYYWTLTAKDFTDLTGTIDMYYNPSDVKVTSPYTVYDYITAKLLNDGSGRWYKYDDVSKFDESNKKLIFDFSGNNDKGITGDYTAGVDGSSFNGAIPDEVPLYVSNGTGTRLNWHTASTWTHDPGLPDYPQGARVKILAGDTVYSNLNYISTYTTDIEGELDVNTTFGNRLGNVSGKGTIYSKRGTLPAGYYEAFFADTGGTVEFGGNSDISILSNITKVNNLKFSGTGKREFPNLDLQILGNLNISGDDNTLLIKNEFNQKISIARNITFNNGSFDAGIDTTSIVEFNGTYGRQTINGSNSFTGSNAFYHVIMNNVSGLLLTKPADISQSLSFDAGIIYTDYTNILRLTNTNENIIIGAGNSKFVDGPLSKNFIAGGNFNFPTGNTSRYGAASVLSANIGGYWTVEYLNHNPKNDSYDPAEFKSPLKMISSNEYWKIKAPATATANVKIRWDNLSGVPADATNRSKLRIAKWTNLSPDKWTELDASNNISGNQNYGTITQTNTSSFNEYTEGNIYTLSSTYSPTSLTWDGSESVVWNNANNWTPAKVPTSADSIIIPSSGVTNEPTIAISAVCKGINLQSGRTLTINPGNSLTTYGDFNLDGTLILKSPVGNGPTASFIDNGTITGSGTMHAERYFTALQYHYLSSPIQAGGNANSNLFTKSNPSGNYNANFYSYNEAYDLDGNPSTAPAGSFNNNNSVGGWVFAHNNDNGAVPIDLDVHKGYAFYTDINQLITFIGRPNTGDMSISNLTYTPNDPIAEVYPNAYDGWNLVANPYPSAIDWDKIKSNLTNIDEGIYVWDGNQYSSYVNGVKGGSGNLTNEIAPMQAFFVHANANHAGFSLNNSDRVNTTTNYLKKKSNSNSKNNTKNNLLSLSLFANGYTDIAAVYFSSQASDKFDKNLEAYKMFAPDYNKVGIPNLFTIEGKAKTPMSINALSIDNMQQKIVPIGISIKTAGEYTITVNKFNFSNIRVYLIDNKENTQTCLNDTKSYSFNFAGGDDRSRFELKFVKNTKPLLNKKLTDKDVYEGSPMKIQLAENTFIDYDKGDHVTYSATLTNGKKLPAWLTFDPQKLNFEGTPTNKDVGSLDIKLIATDKFGATGNTSFNLNIINVNDIPTLENKIPDMSTNIGNLFSYIVPENTFNDIDLGDKLSLSATLANGKKLPTWLTFDNFSNTFSGYPYNEGNLNIKVTATDNSGAKVSDNFMLYILGINGNTNNILVYPNPTNGKFNIVNFKGKVIVTDINGKVLIQKEILNDFDKFDISKYPAGSYLIKFISGKKIKEQIILKK